MSSATALTQGVFYAATGAWPLLHMRSFQFVTGRKRDLWLVESTGSLIAVIGVVLCVSGARRSDSPEMVLLGAASAAALGTIDTVYARRGMIGPIYLLDSAVEAAFVAAWLGAGVLKRLRPG